jgi:hypothetical protein
MSVCSALAVVTEGCGSSCVEQGTVVLFEPTTHASEMCTLTIAGTSGSAIYAFPPWVGTDVPCAVTQGVAPYQCLRRRDDVVINDPYSSTPPPSPADTFEVFFVDNASAKPALTNATDARAYFGSDDISATLVCGSVPVFDHAPRHAFQCLTGL